MSLIPTTVLTGFLGAGKTTLLNHILHQPHGHKIAVIENEFGPENIDNEILVQGGAEQIVEMNNGCICCTVRGDLITTLGELAQKRAAGTLQFDRVVIETTGLANPGPVAQTFFMDDVVAQHYMLDAVVTVVDSMYAMQQLDTHEVAQRQVGFADRILLSKTDLVDSAVCDALIVRLKRMNPRTPISKLDFGRAALTDILDLRGFNLNDKLEIDPHFLADKSLAHGHAGHEHSADCTHDHYHSHHADDIAAFAFTSSRAFDTAKLDEFLGGIVQVYGPQMLRYKGVLWMEGADRKVVFQGIHQMMGSDIGAKWGDDEVPASKLVFIGKNLPQDTIIQGLELCLV